MEQKGDIDVPIAHCREALRLQPDFPEAHNNFENALKRAGEIDGANAHFRETLWLKSDHRRDHNDLRRALDSTLAIGQLSSCPQLGGHYPSAPDARQARDLASGPRA